ncbi:uncharacterized protein [Panulirus ornatus]|uniref:uncharacterized protein n=1 Tax=Panulirus ornatus TaxID=150431 RepID=UPI003A866E7F
MASSGAWNSNWKDSEKAVPQAMAAHGKWSIDLLKLLSRFGENLKCVPRVAGLVHVVVVIANNSCWDVLLVTPDITLSFYNKALPPWKFEYGVNEKEPSEILNCCQNSYLNNFSEEFLDLQCINRRLKRLRIKKSTNNIPYLKFKSEGLHFSVFLKELRNSDVYRLLVLQHWILRFKLKYSQNIVSEYQDNLIIQWTLKDSIPHIIDYEWCIRMKRCAQERQHLDTAMSWLSTLGGACSALGDYDAQFAERAGKISVQQLDIAFRLGDPSIVSRCRLYAAISLIQQCKFKLASAVIKNEYCWIKSLPKETRDQRLVNMCQGIWIKLRHELRLYRIRIRGQGISPGII